MIWRAKQKIVGERFGKLVVLSREDSTKYGEATWLCKCDCGANTIVRGKRLRGGLTKSCGCLRKEADHGKTHGKKYSRVYSIWHGMKGRCLNENDKDFHHYGGRGISIYEHWLTFENFYADMGDPPDGMSIDRINVDGNYEPGNCRWATATVQNRNRRDSVYVDWHGERLHINDVAQRLGITRGAAAMRLKRGKLHA